MPENSALARLVHKVFPHASVDTMNVKPLGGGSINECWRVQTGTHQCVIKANDRDTIPGLMAAEANGLSGLAKADVIRTPEVLLLEEDDQFQYLVLSWIPSGNRSRTFWQRFGEQLAQLHQQHSPTAGWDRDNYMGALPQSNRNRRQWPDFFRNERLQPQLELALQKGLADARFAERFNQLYPRLTDYFPETPMSLLHGDLWSGNFLCDTSEQPVLIDPAVYFGHRSIDMGMTTLFGGFDQVFYESYQYHYPQEGDYKAQWEIATLYPLLIHLNLFGNSYRTSIEAILKKYG